MLSVQFHHSNYWTKDIKRKEETNGQSHQITHIKRKTHTRHTTSHIYHNPMFSKSVHVSCLPDDYWAEGLGSNVSHGVCQVSRSGYPDPSISTFNRASLSYAFTLEFREGKGHTGSLAPSNALWLALCSFSLPVHETQLVEYVCKEPVYNWDGHWLLFCSFCNRGGTQSMIHYNVS